MDEASEAANRAVAANGDNPFTHYQAGLVASRKNDFERAAAEFGRSVELKPDFAYGHYYAGLANQKLRQTAKMSQHLEAFLRLAPDAPERSAVNAVLAHATPTALKHGPRRRLQFDGSGLRGPSRPLEDVPDPEVHPPAAELIRGAIG